jgi:hypothetical protein
VFRETVLKFYWWKWQKECPWDGSESNQLTKLLKCNPALAVEDFARWLYNYGRSEDISPGERPRRFLPRIHNYSVGVLDRYGRSIHAKTGETFADRDSTNTASAAARIKQNLGLAGGNVLAHQPADERRVDEAIPERHKQLPDAGR